VVAPHKQVTASNCSVHPHIEQTQILPVGCRISATHCCLFAPLLWFLPLLNFTCLYHTLKMGGDDNRSERVNKQRKRHLGTERKGRKQRSRSVISSSSDSSRPSQPGNDAGGASSAPNVMELVKELSTGVTEALKGYLGEKIDEVGGKVDSLGDDLRAKLQIHDEQLAEHDGRIACHARELKDHHGKIQELFSRLTEVETVAKHWKEEAQKLGSRLVAAESATPSKYDASEFDRPPNPCALRTNCNSNVNIEVIKSKLAELLPRIGLGLDSVQCLGPPIGRRFVILFKGTNKLGSDRANKLLATMRTGDRKWEPIFVEDPEHAQVQLYFSHDKSDRMERTEVAAKRLHTLLVETHGTAANQKFYLKREDGEIHSAWRPLAKVEVVSKDECKLLWDVEFAVELKIDRAMVAERFAQRTRAKPQTNWSCS
jgi:hypothetical protein